MVVFALVNSANAGGYYIASDRASMGWRGLPHDLAHEMEDVRQKGEEVEGVSIGVDSDWFLRTDARQSFKTSFEQRNMHSNVELFARLMQQGGLNMEEYSVHFFTFVPDQTGYVTILHKTDGSATRCAWHNVPPKLNEVLGRESANGVRHVAVGMNGSYVVLLKTGAMWWDGVPDSLHRLLNDALKKGLEVVTVSLSLVSGSWYFIEFADGATNYILPQVLRDSVDKFIAQTHPKSPNMSGSYSRAPSLVPFRRPPQQQGQSGPLRPLHGTIQQQQQQPVYNITNVYNNPMPETKQRETSTKEDSDDDEVTLDDVDNGLKLLDIFNSLLSLAPGS